MFNIGLKYGLSQLGNEACRNLPAAFMDEPTVAASPLFTLEGVGITIDLIFAYVLGFAAAMAEPALAALRATVQRLTRGAFSPSVIRWAVPFGVSFENRNRVRPGSRDVRGRPCDPALRLVFRDARRA
jgi:hypothetical protein